MRDHLSAVEALFGDQAAWNSLYLKVRGMIRELCARVRSADERDALAADLVQNSYLKLCAKADTEEVKDPKGYLHILYRNDIIAHCKKLARIGGSSGELLERVPEPVPALPPERFEEAVTWVRGRVEREDNKQLFDLFVDGKPNREMRLHDPRSEEQITRERRRFKQLMREAFIHFANA